MQHGRRVIDRRSLSAASADAGAGAAPDPSIEMRVSLFEVVGLVAERGRRYDGVGAPGVRGQVSLEAFPPCVHVGAEVASVPRRVELSSVSLKLVVVAVGQSATHLKDERLNSMDGVAIHSHVKRLVAVVALRVKKSIQQ